MARSNWENCEDKHRLVQLVQLGGLAPPSPTGMISIPRSSWENNNCLVELGGLMPPGPTVRISIAWSNRKD